MVSSPGPCWCCSWKSSTTSGSMDLGEGLQAYPFYPFDSYQPRSSLGTETGSDSPLGPCCPGPGLAHREPGSKCACISPNTRPSPVPGKAPPKHRLGTRGLGQQADVKEGRPVRKDVMPPHPSPLTQPTRVAARTQQCLCRIQRPRRMPLAPWAQQPTGLQMAPSPRETHTSCSLHLPPPTALTRLSWCPLHLALC